MSRIYPRGTSAVVALDGVSLTVGGAEAARSVTAAVTENTRLALLDHITSQTGLVLPIGRLVAALAKYHGVATSEVMVGNGSNEIIDLLVRAFVKDDENVVFPAPSACDPAASDVPTDR